MSLSLSLSLPGWIPAEIEDPSRCYATREDRMDLAVRLAARNIAEGTGGPFGACVFEAETGRLVAPGVNVVMASRCSLAHAETMAIMLAQQASGTFDLGAPGLAPLELVTSAQPCIQCFGAVWWSGLSRVVSGATAEDVESLVGLQEGPIPTDWASLLTDRRELAPVEVVTGCMREPSRAVLRKYREEGGVVYNPGSSGP